MSKKKWTCSTCGRSHAGLPSAIAFPMPALFEELPRGDREKRVLPAVENEAIVIADTAGVPHFFRRGLVEIPTSADEGVFAWNLWVEVAERERTRGQEVD